MKKQKRNYDDVCIIVGEGDGFELLEKEAIDYHHLPTIRHEIRSVRNFINGIISIGKIIYHFKPDIIHTHNYYAANFISKNIFFSKIPHIQTVHANVAFGKLPMFVGDKIIAVSNDIKKKIISTDIKLTPKTVLIASGSEFLENTDAEDASRALQIKTQFAEKIIVLFAGRLVEVKGVKILLSVFEKIFSQRNDIALLIAGDGELENLVISFCNKNSANTVFIGSRKNIFPFYQICDLVIVPSLHSEGLPMVILESGMAKKAVIAAHTNGVGDVIRHLHNGYLIAPGNTEQLSNAIQLLANDGGMRDRLSEKLHEKVVSDYTVDGMYNSYNKIYTEMISHQLK